MQPCSIYFFEKKYGSLSLKALNYHCMCVVSTTWLRPIDNSTLIIFGPQFCKDIPVVIRTVLYSTSILLCSILMTTKLALRRFSFTLVLPARAEGTCESVRLSVYFGAREHAMEVQMFSILLAWRAHDRQSVRKVLCMRFLAHTLTSSFHPRGRNWCNGERL